MSLSGHTTIKPDDKHFIAQWSLRDEEKIKKYTARLAALHKQMTIYYNLGMNQHGAQIEGEYNTLSEIMIELIEKKNNDHHNAKALLGHDWLDVEPINDPKFEPDVVTWQGLNKLLKIYIATASGVFKWMARGTTATTPTPYSTALAAETGTRLDTTTAGFQKVEGSSLKLFASYASTLATHTIHQIACFDASTTGMMLAIHDFGGLGATHTINVDAFSLGIIIDFQVTAEV